MNNVTVQSHRLAALLNFIMRINRLRLLPIVLRNFQMDLCICFRGPDQVRCTFKLYLC